MTRGNKYSECQGQEDVDDTDGEAIGMVAPQGHDARHEREERGGKC